MGEHDKQQLHLMLVSDGRKVAERIVRSRLAAATAQAGWAAVQTKLGLIMQKDVIEENAELAVKLSHWLEVNDELKADKQLVAIIKNT